MKSRTSVTYILWGNPKYRTNNPLKYRFTKYVALKKYGNAKFEILYTYEKKHKSTGIEPLKLVSKFDKKSVLNNLRPFINPSYKIFVFA